MGTDMLLHAELSEAIRGSAMKVPNTLKPGLNENACDKTLANELRKRGLPAVQQRHLDVFYEGQIVAPLVPDLIVNELVVVDPRVAEDFTQTHVALMIGCRSITGLQLALLLNFKHAEQRWKRVLRLSVPIRAIRG